MNLPRSIRWAFALTLSFAMSPVAGFSFSLQGALKRIDEKEFDIVVTDIRMDDIDGIQVLEHVTSKSPRTKVIMITGYAMMALAREAMEKGAFDFIAKPFQPDDLRKVIAKAAKALGSDIDFDKAPQSEA